jgi:hypothetical protein
MWHRSVFLFLLHLTVFSHLFVYRRRIFLHCSTDAQTCGIDNVEMFISQLFKPKEGMEGQVERLEECEPELADIKHIAAVMQERPFSLEYLQERIEKIITKWRHYCFGNSQAYLYGFLQPLEAVVRSPSNNMRGKGSQRKTAKKRKQAVATLQEHRKHLDQNHGDDPLDESRDIAEKATGKPRKSSWRKSQPMRYSPENRRKDDEEADETVIDEVPSKKRKAAKSHDSESSGESEEEEYIDGSEKSPTSRRKKRSSLSSVPRKAKTPRVSKFSNRSNLYKYDPDPGVFNENGKVLRRIPWSDEEIKCLIAGMKTTKNFKKGKLGKEDEENRHRWSFIKHSFSYVLRNRTTVQIKDKVRNMKLNNEIPDDALGPGDKEVSGKGNEGGDRGENAQSTDDEKQKSQDI